MFSKKSLFVSAVLIFTSFLGVSVLNAQDQACPYTLASLQGNYALIGTYGANIAIALGVRSYDGKGNLTAVFLLNAPKVGSTTGERTVSNGKQVGTYTVNCNGTGTFSRILTAPDGTVSTGMDDFIITQAIPWPIRPSIAIATTIVDAQRIPSSLIPGGIFLTRVHTRLPDMER